ncbi:MAG: SUKH-4 family immunity protein [Aggregatilineales bacterium]
MDLAKIRDFWGSDLKLIKDSKVIKDNLSPNSVTFLEQVGLPAPRRLLKERSHYLNSIVISSKQHYDDETVKGTLPFFEFDIAMIATFNYENDIYIKIGQDNVASLAIHTTSEEVYFFYPESTTKINGLPDMPDRRYLNKSIELAVRSLTCELLYRKAMIKPIQEYIRYINIDESAKANEQLPKIDEIVNQMENELRRIDDSPFHRPNSWWLMYLDDTKQT